MRRRAFATLVVCLLLVGGCGDGSGDAPAEGAGADTAAAADSITRRQRDSIIGESRLPGAGGVRGALRASDAAAARAATMDSLSGSP